MTDYSILPYGQSATMPAGYPIADDLIHDSAQQALSARQGKVLKEMIDAKADGDVTIKRFAVNMCDEAKMQSGKELDNSGAVISGGGIVTDFMPAAISGKTQYIQVCCSAFLSSVFGYAATKVCIYNASKTYIGAISSVSAIIDKESQANASLFTNAAYIRVQFASGTTDHYVAMSNKPVLPEYSPYNKEDLTSSADWVAPKWRNTDGSISNMLETALDYIDNLNGLNLGYGDSNTAYDLEVNAVVADPWTANFYQGEKKQINCSCFVQLCLEGVRYSNSRYVLGASADNVGINGYSFDDKVETNYHNAREGDSSWSQYSFTRFIPCSTHNKLYANRQLKYAYDRGFAFLIDSGFKNIEVGDVIFKSTSGNTGFKSVSHVLFVSGVSLKDDGTKVISTMEVTTPGSYGAAVETTGITSPKSGWVYAARFPMPKIASKAKNIVSSVTKETAFSSLNSGVTKVIGTLTLSDNVKAKGAYTAVVKCSAVGDFEVMVGTMSGSTFTALGTNGENLLRRGDGVTVKHFNLSVDSSINTNSLAVAIKTYAALSNNVEIVEAKVYNGFVTE